MKQRTIKVTIIFAAILLLGASEGWATSIAFYEDGVIQEGDEYSYVYVYNNATVDMIGGVVTTVLVAYDSSTVNISGGFLHRIGSSYESAASTLNLSGGMQVDEVEIGGSSVLNIFGGTVGSAEIYSSNAANLYGGIVSEYLMAWGSATINIYGYGFDYDPLAGHYDGGQLAGFWLDDTPFSIDLYYDDTPGGSIIDTWSHIVLIPEPTTILLLGPGLLLLKKRK